MRKVGATWNVGVAERILGTGKANISSKFLLLLSCRPTLFFYLFDVQAYLSPLSTASSDVFFLSYNSRGIITLH